MGMPPQHGSMDSHYQPFYKAAEELQNSFHARLSDPFNPMAMIIKHEADELVSDIAANRSPVEVEERVKNIQQHLQRSVDTLSGQSYMTEEHHQFLHTKYGQLRHDLQELQKKPYFDQPRINPDQHGNGNNPNQSPRGGRPWL